MYLWWSGLSALLLFFHISAWLAGVRTSMENSILFSSFFYGFSYWVFKTNKCTCFAYHHFTSGKMYWAFFCEALSPVHSPQFWSVRAVILHEVAVLLNSPSILHPKASMPYPLPSSVKLPTANKSEKSVTQNKPFMFFSFDFHTNKCIYAKWGFKTLDFTFYKNNKKELSWRCKIAKEIKSMVMD